MEYFDENMYGINWSEYLKMFPTEGRSKHINRKVEVIILQRLLEQGIVNKEPLVLNDFWRCLVEEEKWRGTWCSYRDHYRESLAHSIQELNFIDSKYRALMLYVSSRPVTDTFKKELEKDECMCQYDDHSRIVAIVSKDKQVDVGGKRLRKFTGNNKRKNKKDDEKEDDDKKEDEEDEKEDGDEKNDFKKVSSKNEKDDETKEEDLSQLNPVMTIERFYDNLKTLIQTHCRKNKLEYSFVLELDQESKDKEMSNFQMIKHLKKLASWVTECPDEKTDVVKMDKFQILMMFNAMVGMVPGNDTMKKSIKNALEVECEREENISLELFVLTINAILD